jgi:3-isopropylmalate/(R)-2-methylmalate dehydratase large subunit
VSRGGAGKTISEKILRQKSGADAYAGDVVICELDYALGTDASTPMAIDYFHADGSERVRPERIAFALDHYAPPTSAKIAGFTIACARSPALHASTCGGWVRIGTPADDGVRRCLRAVSHRLRDSHSTIRRVEYVRHGGRQLGPPGAMICGRCGLRVPETTKVWLEGIAA